MGRDAFRNEGAQSGCIQRARRRHQFHARGYAGQTVGNKHWFNKRHRHIRMLFNGGFHVVRIHLETANIEYELDSASDVQETISGSNANVAGSKVAVLQNLLAVRMADDAIKRSTGANR